MKIKLAVLLSMTFAFALDAGAQNVITPPITSFNPDSSLPKVNVPEFVVTGKAQIELPKAEKPSVQIDSSYFQEKRIGGIEMNLPVNRSFASRHGNSGDVSPTLFARASIGHYTTTHYLLSGSGIVSGYLINGSASGDYTAGFIANTIRRDVSIQGGASKTFGTEGAFEATNLLDLGYFRSSYYLYGQLSEPPALRRIDQAYAKFVSNMEVGTVPLAVHLGFTRFSMDDLWNGVQSLLNLGVATRLSVGSGDLSLSGDFHAGTHTDKFNGLSTLYQVPIDTGPTASLNRSIYFLSAGAAYGSKSGYFRYSFGLTYYQYRDDSSSGIGKLYPDILLDYKMSNDLSLFAGYSGSVRESDFSGFLSTDRFVSGPISLRNTQEYANITLGSRIGTLSSLTLIPKVNYQAFKYYPLFVSYQFNNSWLTYAETARIFSVSVTAAYREEYFSADITARFRKGETDLLTSIPNLPPFDLNLGASYKLTRNFVARGWFLFLSSRYSDPALTRKLDPVGLLHFRLSYYTKIASLPFTFFMDGMNLLNQKYFIWQGYQEFPLTLSIGLSSRIL